MHRAVGSDAFHYRYLWRRDIEAVRLLDSDRNELVADDLHQIDVLLWPTAGSPIGDITRNRWDVCQVDERLLHFGRIDRMCRVHCGLDHLHDVAANGDEHRVTDLMKLLYVRLAEGGVWGAWAEKTVGREDDPLHCLPSGRASRRGLLGVRKEDRCLDAGRAQLLHECDRIGLECAVVDHIWFRLQVRDLCYLRRIIRAADLERVFPDHLAAIMSERRLEVLGEFENECCVGRSEHVSRLVAELAGVGSDGTCLDVRRHGRGERAWNGFRQRNLGVVSDERDPGLPYRLCLGDVHIARARTEDEVWMDRAEKLLRCRERDDRIAARVTGNDLNPILAKKTALSVDLIGGKA